MKPQSPEPTFDLAPSVSSAARSYQSGQPQDLAETPQTATSHDSPSYGVGEDFMVGCDNLLTLSLTKLFPNFGKNSYHL